MIIAEEILSIPLVPDSPVVIASPDLPPYVRTMLLADRCSENTRFAHLETLQRYDNRNELQGEVTRLLSGLLEETNGEGSREISATLVNIGNQR